jgi:Rieske Fe-S protein
MTQANHEQQPRRRFLAYVFGILSTLIAAVLAVPLLVFSLLPAFKQAKSQWLELGAVKDVAVDKPTAFVYRYHKFDGYLDKLVHGTVYVVTQDRSEFTVMSNVCTHAACGVRWEEDKKAFYCPCHDGYFDINGKVAGGPPPRPLDKFNHKVEGGKLLIEMRDAG